MVFAVVDRAFADGGSLGAFSAHRHHGRCSCFETGGSVSGPMARVFSSALLTGIFCAVFAVVIDWATNMLEQNQIIAVSFVSGFLGSLFGQAVLAGWRGSKE